MIDFNKLLYLPVDIPKPPNIELAIDIFDKIPPSDFITDTYRKCRHIPILQKDESSNVFNYSQFAQAVPGLIQWLEEYLFSWAYKGKVVIITTEPYEENPTHIDCSPIKFTTLQHKFRYVFQGNVNTLHFETSNGIITPPDFDQPFIMSGRWPHFMKNTGKRKYTLALGAPWEPSLADSNYFQILNRSYKLYSNHYLSFTNHTLPPNWHKLFEEKQEYEKEIEILKSKLLL